MLRFVYGQDLSRYPRLADTMFRDRADQFHRRLGWQVTVDHRGWETDRYDRMNPLYVIWERPDGSHGGSMRFLPTTGPTLVRDHFAHLIPNVDLASPLIWECTRFCLAPNAEGRVAAALMAGGAGLMQVCSVRHFVGVFDARMARIYQRFGASPEVLGSSGDGLTRISVGLWHDDPADRAMIYRRAGLTEFQIADWLDLSFGSIKADAAIQIPA